MISLGGRRGLVNWFRKITLKIYSNKHVLRSLYVCFRRNGKVHGLKIFTHFLILYETREALFSVPLPLESPLTGNERGTRSSPTNKSVFILICFWHFNLLGQKGLCWSRSIQPKAPRPLLVSSNHGSGSWKEISHTILIYQLAVIYIAPQPI